MAGGLASSPRNVQCSGVSRNRGWWLSAVWLLHGYGYYPYRYTERIHTMAIIGLTGTAGTRYYRHHRYPSSKY